MKRRRNIRLFFISLGITLGVGAVSMYSCEKEIITPNAEDNIILSNKTTRPIEGYCGDIQQKSIIFNSNNEEVGQALIYNDQRNFYIELSSWGDYLIEDVFLFVGTDRNAIPLDKFNNPDPISFEYSIQGKPLNNTRKFRLPLNDVPGQSILSCAMELRKPKPRGIANGEEYAWVDGHFFGSSVRGRYFGYDKQICRTSSATSQAE